MNDDVASGPSTPVTSTGADRRSAGALLRAAREATGLHIAALAVSLKVPVRKIEALEADRWDELTDPVFVRALASSACRSLRADPAPILALLPPAPATRLRDAGPLRGSDLSSAPSFWAADWLRPLQRAPVLAALGMLAAAVLVYFWPAGEVSHPVAQSPRLAPMAPTTTGPTDVTVVVPSLPAVAGQDAPSTSQAAAPVAASLPAALPVASLPPLNDAVSTVSFKARGSSWIEVLDARQTVLLRRTLIAGESATAAGEVPLAVVIGRADAIEVQVRGQLFDAQAKSKDNVARFEVK